MQYSLASVALLAQVKLSTYTVLRVCVCVCVCLCVCLFSGSAWIGWEALEKGLLTDVNSTGSFLIWANGVV